MCGVELVVEEFDVEKSPGCANAYLFLAKHRYCGSIDQGAQSKYDLATLTDIFVIFQTKMLDQELRKVVELITMQFHLQDKVHHSGTFFFLITLAHILEGLQNIIIPTFCQPIRMSYDYDGKVLSFTGLVPFGGREPIVLIFVGGQFSSGAGFNIRGRQIPCAKAEETAPRLTEGVEQQRQPQLSRGQKSRNKRVTLPEMRETEAEWLNLRVNSEDMVLDWVGPGGRSGDQLTHR